MIDYKEVQIGDYVTSILNDEPQEITTIISNKVRDGVIYSFKLDYGDRSFLPEHLFPIPEQTFARWADGSFKRVGKI